MPIKDDEARREYMREYRAKNREHLGALRTEARRKFREANPPPIRQRAPELPPEKQRAKHAAEMREWRKKQGDAYREWHRKYRAKNKYKINDQKRQERISHPGREETRDGNRYWNNPARREYCIEGSKRRHRENPNKLRAFSLKKNYGISLTQWDAMLVSQSGRCNICSRCMGYGRKEPHVDHCHSTGKVRGLLCENCNKAIGLLHDSPEVCRLAAAYLELHFKQ